ncbi:hypothetical protein [Sphingomonas phyllosphaerae]|uniref:hypothetical protein n=1 Tax=Sphingomonas phyllosphaerae TaxID=257003 RepID=UPI0012DEA659|nr:hypothetical protein [Sphingomonas phyllosphaerae]
MMNATEKMQPKKRGRPAIGQGVPIQVRLQPDQLAALDGWIAHQEPTPSRPEAIRTLLRQVLA